MLCQEPDGYVPQFQVAYLLVLHWHPKNLVLLLTIPQWMWKWYLIVWKALIVLKNLFHVPRQKNISLIYLHYTCDCGSMPFKINSSRLAINITVYDGANLVPLAIPRKYFKVFHWTERCCSLKRFLQVLLKCQLSLFSVLASKTLLSVTRPSWFGILG